MGAMKAALEIALFSLRKVGPVVSKLWFNTRDFIANTKAKPLVCNPIVRKAELVVDRLHVSLVSKCVEFRARLLPKELENLEKEVERLKREIEETKK